jgi:hypothetical protein
MNATRSSVLFLALLALLASASHAREPAALVPDFGQAYLGPAPWLDPAAPPPVPAPPAVPKVVVSVPAIDTSNRTAVAAAYDTYYDIAMPAVGFTGSTATCTPGTISLAFQEWTISRINFLRAMAGVPGNTTLDSTKNTQQQAAALIMAANSSLSHFPPGTWQCWTQAGYDGAGSSNLALGTGLTDSIPLYMTDPGTGNQDVGHRRWILHSQKGSFGLGQANGPTYNANALSVFDFGGAASAPNGIAWPPRGHVPLALFPSPSGGEGQRWSFGMPGANFASANVTMTLDGSPLAVSVVSRTANGYGDNTIVWQLPGGHTVSKGSTYNVSITGVANAGSTAYSYQVLPFDPADVVTTFNLAVTKSGAGSGTVTSSPVGIDCGATCAFGFNAGSSVTLTATPAGGSVFAGWSGGGCSGTGTCTVTMNAAASVAATFMTQAGTLALSANPASVAFGAQSMGTTSPAQSVTVVNVGNGPVSVSGVSTTNAQLAQTNNCATLAVRASCTVNVTFSPSISGGALLSTVAASGSLTVTSNAVGSPLTVPLSGTGEKSLVTHYYRSILRRAPDDGGKAYWSGEAARVQALGLNVNEVWFAMAGSFFASAEYQAFGRDDTGFVTDLYNTFFNRAPDGDGLAFWTGQLSSGLPREVTLVAFMFSTEFRNFTQAIFGTTAVRAEVDTVTDFYRGLLARLPDDGGFAFWLARFRAAQCLGGNAVNAEVESISSLFALSAEYAARNRSNAQYVGDLYNAFLRRDGELAGVLFWINEISSGARTREQVRQAFVASPEFQARVAAIIAAGCVP